MINITHSDYYPSGMPLPGRQYSSDKYRFGFNGQEKDNEVYGIGNLNTAEFWEYDTRLIRRWNIDPVVKPWESSYLCFSGNPIWFSDVNGDKAKNGHKDEYEKAEKDYNDKQKALDDLTKKSVSKDNKEEYAIYKEKLKTAKREFRDAEWVYLTAKDKYERVEAYLNTLAFLDPDKYNAINSFKVTDYYDPTKEIEVDFYFTIDNDIGGKDAGFDEKTNQPTMVSGIQGEVDYILSPWSIKNKQYYSFGSEHYGRLTNKVYIPLLSSASNATIAHELYHLWILITTYNLASFDKNLDEDGAEKYGNNASKKGNPPTNFKRLE